MQIIPLQSEDDITSICDRLNWAHDSQVIFVLPDDGGVLREGLDLVRLLRKADSSRIEIGLITHDVEIIRQAKGLGIPTFDTIRQAKSNRRGWWRGKRRQELVGLPTNGDARFDEQPDRMDLWDKEEAHRRLSPKSMRRKWVLRYTAILLFFVVMALLFVTFSYVVPRATVTLYPDSLPLRIEQTIVADPNVDAVNYAQYLVPGRILSVTTAWEAEMQTTGSTDVPEAPARGTVVFVNQIEQPVTVPAGTRVSTSDGSNIVYQTVEDATLPDTIGSTTEMQIIAIEPGPQGNVPANLVNRVEGTLATQVEVRNLDAIEGGGNRSAAAVTAADREALRAQVMQYLQAAALAEMADEVTVREFLTPDSLRVANIINETYSHDIGEQTDRLTLQMQVVFEGTAVNTTESSGIAFEALAILIPEGFALVPDSIRFESGNVTAVDEQGRVTFSMIAEGRASAELDVSQQIETIIGQDPETAVTYLNQRLPLREPTSIEIWPVWFERVPYLTSRIETEIVP